MPIVCKRKEIIKIRVETSEIHKSKRWFYKKPTKVMKLQLDYKREKEQRIKLLKQGMKKMGITRNERSIAKNTNPLQTLIKNKKRGNISQLIL